VKALAEAVSRPVPVIIVSSESDPRRIVQAGARSYIVKPFTAEQLKEQVAPLLEA